MPFSTLQDEIRLVVFARQFVRKTLLKDTYCTYLVIYQYLFLLSNSAREGKQIYARLSSLALKFTHRYTVQMSVCMRVAAVRCRETRNRKKMFEEDRSRSYGENEITRKKVKRKKRSAEHCEQKKKKSTYQ